MWYRSVLYWFPSVANYWSTRAFWCVNWYIPFSTTHKMQAKVVYICNTLVYYGMHTVLIHTNPLIWNHDFKFQNSSLICDLHHTQRKNHPLSTRWFLLLQQQGLTTGPCPSKKDNFCWNRWQGYVLKLIIILLNIFKHSLV